MSAEKLFTPLKVGAVTAPNRVFMAPLTRLRSIEPGDIPTPLMGEYYRQRASSGLIISEATQISAQQKATPVHRVCTARNRSPRGKKSPQACMLKMAVLRFSCGTPVVSHTAASSLAVRRRFLPLPSTPIPALPCAMKTVMRSASTPPRHARWSWTRSRVS